MQAARQDQQRTDTERHIAAIRAFHTGLVAETQRHLRVLREMSRYIDLLRRPQTTPPAKLAALRAACRELRALEALKQPWRETYRDLRQRLRRARVLLTAIVYRRRPSSRPPRQATSN
jgi:hypothetical protein